MTTHLTEAQHRIIERMGLDPDDNRGFLDGFASGAHAAAWFTSKGWPKDWPPVTDDDRDALRSYIAK
jgi:hypothetical protein